MRDLAPVLAACLWGLMIAVAINAPDDDRLVAVTDGGVLEHHVRQTVTIADYKSQVTEPRAWQPVTGTDWYATTLHDHQTQTCWELTSKLMHWHAAR